MFWKIIFAIYMVLLFILGFQSTGSGEHSNIINSTNVEGLQLAIIAAGMYLLFSVLYGLARKIRTLPLYGAKILIAITILINACLALNPEFYSNHGTSSSTAHLAALIVWFGFCAIVFAVPLLVLYVPFIGYFRNFGSYSKALKNQFFSTLALFFAVSLIIPSFCKDIYLIFIEPVEESLWKVILGLVCQLYVIMCYVGFVLRRNFINKTILKWTFIPAVGIFMLGLSLTELKSDFQEALTYPLTIQLSVLLFAVLEFLIIYRYVWTDLTSDTPDYREVVVIENK